jgi:hypothetical protein
MLAHIYNFSCYRGQMKSQIETGTATTTTATTISAANWQSEFKIIIVRDRKMKALRKDPLSIP